MGKGGKGRKRGKAGKTGRGTYRCADGKEVKIHKGERGGEFIMTRKKGGGVTRRNI